MISCIHLSSTDGKYHMTPDGELHVLNVSPQDGHSRFQCRTLHKLTGTTQLSITPARIIVTGKYYSLYINNPVCSYLVQRLSCFSHCNDILVIKCSLALIFLIYLGCKEL